MKKVMQLDPNEVVIGKRFRETFTDIDELAASIEQHGQLQPIGVAKKGDRWQLVYGHRRLLACKSLGIPVAAIETKPLTGLDAELQEYNENAARSNFTPLEEAVAAYKIHQKLKRKHGDDWSQAKTAKALGISRPKLGQLFRIYRTVYEDNRIPAEKARGLTLTELLEIARLSAEPGVQKPEGKITLLQGSPSNIHAMGVARHYYHCTLTWAPENLDPQLLWPIIHQVLLLDRGVAMVFCRVDTWTAHTEAAKLCGFPVVLHRPFVWVRSSAGKANGVLPVPGYEVAVLAKRAETPLQLPSHADWVSLPSVTRYEKTQPLATVLLNLIAPKHHSFIDPWVDETRGGFLRGAIEYGLTDVCGVVSDPSLYKKLREDLG